MAFIAYSTASANALTKGDTVADCLKLAAIYGPDTRQFLIVFDAGDAADEIAHPIQAHKLVRNLTTRCTVVWRGDNPLAQSQFGGGPAS